MTEKPRTLQGSGETLPAVILAAGQGLRLREESGSAPKPLTPLLGSTLLEHTVLSCRAIGVTECYVIVGYGREQMLPHIAELAARHRVRLHGVDNPQWPEGNGTSALAVAPYLAGPFLLLMCDHVFDSSILQTLLEAGQHSQSCLLAVDHRIDDVFDLADATKVRLHGQTITAIGKELTPFDAIDTGLFLCRPSVFKALEQARMEGDGSLSAGMRRLIGATQLHAVDIGKRFWCDIDTPQSLQHAEHLLLAGLTRPPDSSAVSRGTRYPVG
jgi:1L-myo-inositol 1-phosphate cytidylyltransferase